MTPLQWARADKSAPFSHTWFGICSRGIPLALLRGLPDSFSFSSVRKYSGSSLGDEGVQMNIRRVMCLAASHRTLVLTEAAPAKMIAGWIDFPPTPLGKMGNYLWLSQQLMSLSSRRTRVSRNRSARTKNTRRKIPLGRTRSFESPENGHPQLVH